MRDEPNRYDKIIEELARSGEFGATSAEPAISWMPVTVFALCAAVLLVCIILVWKARRRIGRGWQKKPAWLRAIVSGYAVWAFVVLTYVYLFAPFGYRMYAEDVRLLIGWVALPPLCIAFGAAWVRSYWLKRNDF